MPIPHSPSGLYAALQSAQFTHSKDQLMEAEILAPYLATKIAFRVPNSGLT